MTHDNYLEWEQSVPASERADAIWRVEPYRRSRFLLPQARQDARSLILDPLGRPLTNQLWRSAVSIAANIAEGYSRGTGADRARFYEYALGSARECIVWYEAA
jgi:four helix bundle protein